MKNGVVKMNSGESWKWKDVKEKTIHPTSVCVFCKFCTKDKDTENWQHISDHNLLCTKHPTMRTIHPISGQPVYAYWDKNQETVISEEGREVCETEPTVEFTGEKFQFCGNFNMDGKCKNFKKIGTIEEEKRFLSIGDEEPIYKMLPFK